MKPVDRLAEAFCAVEDTAMMKKFFREIFSPAEMNDLALRWRVMEMLEEGVTQRRIADRLGVSLCKITRGSKVLKKRGSVTRCLLERDKATPG